MAQARTAMLRLSALVGERTLFENDAFRRLWISKLLSHIPVNAIVYTMLIMVVRATGRSFFSSLFVVAYIAPTALLGTVSGVMVDRMPKGPVLAATNAARAALCVLLISGILLTITEPARELLNWVFRIKMLLVLLLAAILLLVQRRVRRDPEYWTESPARRRAARAIGILFFVIGAGIVTAGRWIAYV